MTTQCGAPRGHLGYAIERMMTYEEVKGRKEPPDEGPAFDFVVQAVV